MLPPARSVVVTAHVVRELRLRSPIARHAIERALATSRARADFQIVRLTIAASRLELVVVTLDRMALARGMQGFQVAAARYLNAVAHRRGSVFPDRYRVRILTRSSSR